MKNTFEEIAKDSDDCAYRINALLEFNGRVIIASGTKLYEMIEKDGEDILSEMLFEEVPDE